MDRTGVRAERLKQGNKSKGKRKEVKIEAREKKTMKKKT